MLFIKVAGEEGLPKGDPFTEPSWEDVRLSTDLTSEWTIGARTALRGMALGLSVEIEDVKGNPFGVQLSALEPQPNSLAATYT